MMWTAESRSEGREERWEERSRCGTEDVDVRPLQYWINGGDTRKEPLGLRGVGGLLVGVRLGKGKVSGKLTLA